MDLIDLSTIKDGEIATRQDIYEELFGIEDFGKRISRENEILRIAAEQKVKTTVVAIIKRYEARERKDAKIQEAIKKKKEQEESIYKMNLTQFNYGDKDYPVLACGAWYANDYGVQAPDFSITGHYACRNPILLLRILENVETGKEYAVIAFKKTNGRWNEKTFPKSTILKAREVTELSDYGVLTSSEDAKYLVRYFADLELLNPHVIKRRRSTSKFGWKDNFHFFTPFDKEIEFDATERFKDLFNSLEPRGSYNIWLNLVLDIRNKNYIEPRLALAASFASVLLKIINVQPFIVDFFGLTEGGKTVTLMLATSVWANPSENMYMGDFKSTDTSLEVHADILNNLPLILDDTSKASSRIRENFESLVYDLCSGKGKSRSNKELGLNRESNWHLCTICNGETPLSGYVNQGGAINRIIEVECSEKIFEDPRNVADVVRENYGHAGRLFVDYIKTVPTSDLLAVLRKYEDALTTEETMQKQVLAMAAILMADEIATECIFKDGNNLRAYEVKKYLTDLAYVDDGARCYQYLIDTFRMSQQHFDLQFTNIDQWGEYDEKKQVIAFYISAFENILAQKGYSRKGFASWAKRHNLLECDKKRDTKLFTFKIEKKQRRAIVLKIDYSFVQDNDEGDDSIFD